MRTAPESAMEPLTCLLERVEQGDAEAEARLTVLLYDELRRLARREMAKERADHTLQPTALVHEAYLRLLGPGGGRYQSRGHFWTAAARAVRQVLVEHARKRGRRKRGGNRDRVQLDDDVVAADPRDERLLAVDEALARLAAIDPSKARLVELRFFAGMTLDEAGEALGVSQSTVVREWRTARAWLQAALDERGGGP